MPRRLGELQQFVSDALQAYLKELNKDLGPAAPVREGPPFPYVGEDKIASKVSASLSTPEATRRQLVRRLRRFRYPYPEGNKRRRKTFYRHVEDLGLLDPLLHPPFLWNVRTAWFFRRHYDLEARLFTGKKSQHGYPLAFHGEMMREICGHLGRISRIARKHGVPKKWFADCYSAIQKQLLREASVCYPQLRAGFKPISRIRPYSLEVDIQVDLFHAIRAAFAERRISNNQLAYQLTALICSSQNCIRTHVLDPSPETVRRNVTDRSKKTKRNQDGEK